MPSSAPITDRACEGCHTVFQAKCARWCPDCRWRVRGRRTKYHWTPERDAYLLAHWDIRRKERSTEIAAHFGWPRWVITHRSRAIGLSRAKEPNWTAEQEAFLRAHVHKRTAHWMWVHLPAPRRSETAIIVKLKRLVGSRRLTDGGYTLLQLVALFGFDHHVISRWATDGHLRVQTRGYRNPARDAWCVEAADVLAFLREHRDLYDLRRVDQPAFLALVFGEAAPQIKALPRRARAA
jgi:hypothetical protein